MNTETIASLALLHALTVLFLVITMMIRMIPTIKERN